MAQCCGIRKRHPGTIARSAMACPFGWTPAPQDGGAYSARCYASVDWAASLRECVENCGPEAAPVCPSSAAENSLLARLAADEAIDLAWLGMYRSASGAFECVADASASTGYSNWSPLFFAESELATSGVLTLVVAGIVVAAGAWPRIVSRNTMHTIWHAIEFVVVQAAVLSHGIAEH